jgi:hypothetical protein
MIFVALVIIGSIFKKKIVVAKIAGNLCGLMVLLILFTCYVKYWPALEKYTETSTPTSTTTKPTTTKSSSTPTSTTKQLYYGGGCSSCYADSCPRNGYSYGGYDVYYYNYYRSLCQACQCSSSRWQSLWR